MTEPAVSLVRAPGFAGLGSGTSGGADGPTVVVSSASAIQAAIAAATKPTTILISGVIRPDSTVRQIEAKGRTKLTFLGEAGTVMEGIGFHVVASTDLVFRNLRIGRVPATAGDAIGIEIGCHHIWIDHCEFYGDLAGGKDTYDGLIDVKRGSTHVTVSASVLRDHHKVSLNGYSDVDKGDRLITFVGNLFRNVGSRLPLQRFGQAHVLNNLYQDVEISGVNVRMGGVCRIEGNVFENVRNPIVSMDSKTVGFWDLADNLFDSRCTWTPPGKHEASAQSGRSTGAYRPPYAYDAIPADRVKAFVLANAGVHRAALKPTLIPTDSPLGLVERAG